MAALTLTNARAVVREYLDSVGNTENWNDASVDRALAGQLNACMTRYISTGGDHFVEEVTGATTDADNKVDLSAVDPMEIVGVSIKQSNRFFPIRPTRMRERNSVSTGAFDIKMQIVRLWGLSTTGGDPLVFFSGVTAPEWLAFDHWVCARAAQQLAVKDEDQAPALRAIEAQYREVVLERPPVVKARRWPQRARWYSRSYFYAWDANNQTIEIVRTGWW